MTDDARDAKDAEGAEGAEDATDAKGARSSQGESQATDYRWLAVQQACGRGTLRVHLGVHPVKERKWISITWAEVGRALRRVLKTLHDEGRATTPAEVLEVMPLLALCVGIERQLLGLPAPRADRESPSSPASLRDDWTSVEPAARVVEYLGAMKDEAMSKTPTSQPDEVTAAYIDNFVALDAGRRQFEVWRSQVMSRLDVVVSSALEKAKCPALNKKYTEGGGTMWGYYLPTPRAIEAASGDAQPLTYAGFWMGFIAGTSYGPCDEDGKYLDPSSDPLANKLVFRADLWFNTTSKDRRVVGETLRLLLPAHLRPSDEKPGHFDFEGAKVYVPISRVAVSSETSSGAVLDAMVSQIAELHEHLTGSRS